MSSYWFRTAVPSALAGLLAAGSAVISVPSSARQTVPQPQRKSPLLCPVMNKSLASLDQAWTQRDVKGVRYYLCCKPCEEQFDKEPATFTVAPSDPTKVSGVFLFDPVTTKRLDMKKAVAYAVYQGVAFPFATPQNKAAFDKEPTKYASRPEKELLFCPVSSEVVKSYAAASDYSDLKGERIYFCCPGCKEKFDANPAKYADAMKQYREKQSGTVPVTTGAKNPGLR